MTTRIQQEDVQLGQRELGTGHFFLNAKFRRVEFAKQQLEPVYLTAELALIEVGSYRLLDLVKVDS